jgi:mono/diheme cytochrome c family protein
VCFVLAALAALAQLASDAEPDSQAPSNDQAVARGRYLVHHVAMCVECHTPRRRDRSLDRDRLLSGAPVPVAAPYMELPWAFDAPSIAGLPGGWAEEDLVRLLTTGQNRDGYRPKPPMPPFRMNEQDAAAVAAFLKSCAENCP